jgi:Dockerin type I domain
MSRPYSLRTLSLCIALATTSLARAALIDDFSAGPFSLEAIRYQTKSIEQSNLPADHVIGGSRFVRFNGLGPTSQSSVSVGVAQGEGHLHYDADPGSSAANFEIAYGKDSNLHADLLADGSNSLVYEFGTVNFESGVGYFDLFVNTQSERLYLYAPVHNSSGPTSLILPYWAFNREPYDANFADIAGVSIGTSNGNLRGDFVLTSIRTAFYPRGDYNFDGRIDQADFLGWRNSFGQPGPYLGGYPVDAADGNRDGIVDASDYVLWRKSFSLSASAASGPSTVPEAGVFLLVIEAMIGAAYAGVMRICRI